MVVTALRDDHIWSLSTGHGAGQKPEATSGQAGEPHLTLLLPMSL